LYIGRTKILNDATTITASNVAKVLSEAMTFHCQNKSECDYLYNYYKGKQPILNRTKTIRPEICNKIVENRANELVAFKTGYLCGEPLQYVSRGASDAVSNEISRLNDMMLLCSKSELDKEIAEWMYICGTAYRIVLPNASAIRKTVIPHLLNAPTPFTEDEAPFSIYTLDPRYCFIVYRSDLGEQPLMGVKYVVKQDKSVVYSVYTPTQYFELTGNEIGTAVLNESKTAVNVIGSIPIIEYPLNSARLGSFEVVLPILDAINMVQSNRIDGIEQFIQSLLVLYNCDIDDDLAKSLREAGLIKLKSSGDQKADVKEIATQLNQTETQTLIDYMYQTALNIVGAPNRNGGSSTSDTGLAVQLRDGYQAAEGRAKNDELLFKSCEHNLLKIVLKIMRDTVGTTLKLSDIDVKFTRRNYADILAKAQVLTTMLNSPQIAPSLAFQHCGMFSDPEDAAKQSAEYYEQNKSGGDGTIA
jgi:SPP1 family phage portal protein